MEENTPNRTDENSGNTTILKGGKEKHSAKGTEEERSEQRMNESNMQQT